MFNDFQKQKGIKFDIIKLRQALKQVVGTYGIIVLCVDEPQKMIAARHGSPLVMGVNSGE